ncbi:MAG: 1-deoxy-D-xylulose-5-phosphate synthase [Bacteroidales bacterium]|nr:1-deoxy-D-xylulose-5-phosphate synthase [Bacteroidales bacterium]
MYKYLDHIESPEDFRSFSPDELRDLCAEVRDYMVQCCAKSPGHLGSSLGAVELIVGYHYVFDTPRDKIVFDVGHQAYAHKILTGRREAFRNLRAQGGPSGFPQMSESPYDAFGAGHSSVSVSAALGFAEAARMQGGEYKVAALIGDGALTGGLAFEGLNNAGESNADILILLNDNNQSIDAPRGALHRYLLQVTTSKGYNRIKKGVWNVLGEGRIRRMLQRSVRSVKSWFVKRSGGDFFESLGLRYFGPVDGNDIEAVVRALRRLKPMSGPRLLHCITVKGKGFAPAEADPVVWHAPGRFDPQTGERIPSVYGADRYQDVFGEVLCQLCDADPRVVGITPAMSSGCGMTALERRHPERFFDVGIEEEHAVTFSAGLAAGGMRPYCNIYSAFSQRAYDQIIHDVALQNLPVVLCFDRAGLVGEDGATHNGIFDMAAYRSIPGTVVSAPRNELQLKGLMYSALRHDGGPYIIRYPRGTGEGVAWKDVPAPQIPVGTAEMLLEGTFVTVLGIGPVVNCALEAAAAFEDRVGVCDMRFLKPLDKALLDAVLARSRVILTVEDGCLAGGLYGAVCEYVQEKGAAVRVHGIGVPDRFIPHARQTDQREECGLSTRGIEETLKSILQ